MLSVGRRCQTTVSLVVFQLLPHSGQTEQAWWYKQLKIFFFMLNINSSPCVLFVFQFKLIFKYIILWIIYQSSCWSFKAISIKFVTCNFILKILLQALLFMIYYYNIITSGTLVRTKQNNNFINLTNLLLQVINFNE